MGWVVVSAMCQWLSVTLCKQHQHPCGKRPKIRPCKGNRVKQQQVAKQEAARTARWLGSKVVKRVVDLELKAAGPWPANIGLLGLGGSCHPNSEVANDVGSLREMLGSVGASAVG